jgi:glutamate synthase (NADPH/NADH) large chain
MQLSYNVENTQRAIGTRLSSHIVRRFGMTGLREGHISVRLHGSGGQSLGAFATQGLWLEVIGDANDYVGKGLSGGVIVLRPSAAASFIASDNTIIGNTVLYGATSGKLFAAGQAGERLCVRNSGATAIVEGAGSNACEYMTGGTVVVLGEVGHNFGAGMTGGMAFIYDPQGSFLNRANPETLNIERIKHPHWEMVLRDLIIEHGKATQSVMAARLLNQWATAVEHFWQAVPNEIIPVLEVPLAKDDAASRTA